MAETKPKIVWRIDDNKHTLFWRAWGPNAKMSSMFKRWDGERSLEHPRIYYDRAEAERFMRPICESKKTEPDELKMVSTSDATYFFVGDDPESAYAGHGYIYGILLREEMVEGP